MRVFLIGQKWLGAEVLELLRRRGDEIVGCCAPEGDRLFKAAGDLAVAPAGLTPDQLPDGLDLIVCAHAHIFVKAELRNRARLGALLHRREMVLPVDDAHRARVLGQRCAEERLHRLWIVTEPIEEVDDIFR